MSVMTGTIPPLRLALAQVDAAHLLGRRTHELSGGELQRVCLASALALEPRLRRYCETIMAMPEMREWVAAAQAEPDDIAELDMEF